MKPCSSRRSWLTCRDQVFADFLPAGVQRRAESLLFQRADSGRGEEVIGRAVVGSK